MGDYLPLILILSLVASCLALIFFERPGRPGRSRAQHGARVTPTTGQPRRTAVSNISSAGSTISRFLDSFPLPRPRSPTGLGGDTAGYKRPVRSLGVTGSRRGGTSASVAVAFLSYARIDDRHGKISIIRDLLEQDIQEQTGRANLLIFQDHKSIKWGQAWAKRIEKSLDEVIFLVPVLTPSFFNSEPCRQELSRFLRREEKLRAASECVLPIYWARVPHLDRPDSYPEPEARILIKEMAARQREDLRHLREMPAHELKDAPPLHRAIARMAEKISDALHGTSAP